MPVPDVSSRLRVSIVKRRMNKRHAIKYLMQTYL
jgi:hypothetical protein